MQNKKGGKGENQGNAQSYCESAAERGGKGEENRSAVTGDASSNGVRPKSLALNFRRARGKKAVRKPFQNHVFIGGKICVYLE